MEQGFNSDVVFQGLSYHIQTEDWGSVNPFVVTRVFQSGSVIKSVKTAYVDIEKTNPAVGREAIRLGMRDQHQKVLDQLVSGSLTADGLK